MAVNKKQFTQSVSTNIKADAKYTKFFINFTTNGKRVNRVVDYSDKSWDKRTRVSKIKMELEELKDKLRNTSGKFTDTSTLNYIAETLYTTNPKYSSQWGKDLYGRYKLYCEHGIGKKQIRAIKKLDIDSLIQQMQICGYSKQTKNGCSIATIKKVIIQALKPVLQYAVDNGVIDKIPPIDIPKDKISKKKVVKDAQVKLVTLFTTINEIYTDDAFYRALFLFALYGRRWNEIRTLKWCDIDFLQNTYTIRAENNKVGENQTYDLATPIILALQEIKDTQSGLVFKSPATGKELYSPKKQLSRIKEKSGIEELTMHYFRHILVSAMGEMGTANTILSASLGHTNLQTVNDFYLSANHTKASAEANKTLDMLISTDFSSHS
jgi:integrase